MAARIGFIYFTLTPVFSEVSRWWQDEYTFYGFAVVGAETPEVAGQKVCCPGINGSE
jgi:hypothetical protein